MQVRWRQSAPCLSPPATAKFAFAPDGPVIHPPPVTKSPLGQGGGPAHEMSACADAMTTSATPVTVTWSALTVMSPGPPVCSLMTTWPWPLGKVIVWLGSPETTIAWPLITSSAISELPLAVGPALVHCASARAMRNPAETLLPPAVRLRLATDASERL